MDENELLELTGSNESEPQESEPDESPEGEAVAESEESGKETGEAEGASPAEPELEPDDYDPDDPAERTPVQRRGLRKALAAKKAKWREKEQQLIAERERLRGELEAVRRQTEQPTRPDEPESSPEDDFYRDPVKYIEARERQLATRFEQQRIEMAVVGAKARYKDYGDAESAFIEAANENKNLWGQMRNAPDPAEFAYRYGKNLIAIGETGSIDDLRAKIEKETREKIEQEYREKLAQQNASKPTPTSAGARGVSAKSPVAVTPIDDFDFDAALKGANYM